MTIHIFEEGFVPLPVYFVTCSSRHLQEAVERREGLGDISQLLFVLDGEGVLHCDGGDYPLKKGSAFYVEHGVSHAYESIGGLVTAWITWRGSGSDDIRNYIGKKSFLFLDALDVKKYVAQIEQIEREYFGQKREGLLSAMLYSMLISFFEEQKNSTVSDMDRVLRYMEEHFDRKITVSELTKINHSSKSSFCKKFKQTFGCTAFEKLIEIRLLNAETMLRLDPNDKISVIAKKCGFDDISYFCKAYKKKFSVTPAEGRLR